MLKTKLKFSSSIVLLVTVIGISGCSAFSQVGKSARNLTTFGNNGVDEKLIIPPTLKIPPGSSGAVATKPTATNRQPTQRPKRAVYQPDGNYYIIVGTYPDQLDALDTFTRLSSIGLKGATMESRQTKAGSLLHMVRLGPYTRQQDIDQAKDSLTNTGLSQFKIVKN